MRETREGEWIFLSEKIKNKYSDFTVHQITRTRRDDDFAEYRAIATEYNYPDPPSDKSGEGSPTEDQCLLFQDEYILNIKTYMNYVSMSSGLTEYDADSYIEVVGALNVDNKVITLPEIIYYLNWNLVDENYLQFD